MVAADFGAAAELGVDQVGVADDRDVIAERLERRQARRELEIGAFLDRRPVVLGQPLDRRPGSTVHHLDRGQPRLPDGRGLSLGGCGRHHRIQKRQRDGGADAAKDRPSGKVFLGDEHSSPPIVPTLSRKWRSRSPCRDRSSIHLGSSVRVCAPCPAIRVLNGALFTMPRTNPEKRPSSASPSGQSIAPPACRDIRGRGQARRSTASP